MSNLDKLASLFKERNNPSIIGITIGEVISVNPIRIKYGTSIILDTSHLIFADSLINGYAGEYTDNNGTTIETKTVTVRSELQAGNKVIMIPSNDFKKWYVLDKAVKL